VGHVGDKLGYLGDKLGHAGDQAHEEMVILRLFSVLFICKEASSSRPALKSSALQPGEQCNAFFLSLGWGTGRPCGI
jgi:hypothetical protein